MDARLQRRIQQYGWDRASHAYERGWREPLAPAQALLLEMAALAPGEVVLDVACGTGLVTLQAARRVAPLGCAVGVDLSQDMVDLAAQRAEAEVLPAAFVRMDAEQLQVGPATFDAALCALGLMYVPDPVAALREQHRVLRPGGRAVAAVWGAREQCGWAEVFPIVARRVRSDVCPLFFRLGSGDALAQAMRAAGFARVEVRRIRTTLRYASAAAALDAAFVGGPVALAHARFPADVRQAAHDEYLASIARWREPIGGTGLLASSTSATSCRGDGETSDDVGYAIPGEFVVARGERIA